MYNLPLFFLQETLLKKWRRDLKDRKRTDLDLGLDKM